MKLEEKRLKFGNDGTLGNPKKYLFVIILIAVSLPVFSKPSVVIRDSESFPLFSKVIDEKLQIDIFLPKNYYQEKAKKYPVVYIETLN